MRVSAGLEVTTLSGKMRIQTLPPRLRWWVIVRRAASIWRAVIQAGSRVRMANSPKAMVLPRMATPPRPPWVRFIILRCFIRLGCSIGLLLARAARRGSGGRGGRGGVGRWARRGRGGGAGALRGGLPRRRAGRAGGSRPIPRLDRTRRRASSPLRRARRRDHFGDGASGTSARTVARGPRRSGWRCSAATSSGLRPSGVKSPR